MNKNEFTYQDLSGRTRLRRYVVAAIAIVGLIAALVVVFGGMEIAESTAEAQKITAIAQGQAPTLSVPTNTPAPTNTPTAVPPNP